MTTPNSIPPIATQGNEPKESVGSRLKAAGHFAVKQAERTKLTTITLPAAYRELGKHLYQAGAFREDFPQLYNQFSQLEADLKSIKSQAAARPVSQGFTDKAKALGHSAKDMAQTKAIQHKVNGTFTELGRTAFEKFGQQVGSSGIVQPITTAKQQVAKLDDELAAISGPSQGKLLTPKRIAIAGVVLVVLIFIGVISNTGDNQKSSSSNSSRYGWDDADKSSAVKVDATTPENEDNRAVGETYKTNTMNITRLENGPRYAVREWAGILITLSNKVNKLGMSEEEVEHYLGKPTYKERLIGDRVIPGVEPFNGTQWVWKSISGNVDIAIAFENGRLTMIQVGREVTLSN